MKMITKRGIFLWLIIICFLGGLGFLTYSFVTEANEWVMHRYNYNLYSHGSFIGLGTIYDRNGVELVKTEDSDKIYNEDEGIRKSTLHIVGDKKGFISTGIQETIDADLTGYSLLNGVYNIKKAGRGNDIKLSVDADVCETALKALDGRKGTVGVFNYKTGEIICNVSSPTYDVNDIPKDIDSNDKYSGAYMNKLISGLYAPGSTFKIVVTICAIENIPDIMDRTWKCTGSYKPEGGGEIICNATHGRINLKQALSKSCNSTFAQIAIELGTEKLTQTVKKLGLTSPVYIDSIKSSTGRFDLSDAQTDDLGWAGIGQYTTMVSPVAMMRLAGAIGNEGKAVPMTYMYPENSNNPLKESSSAKEEQLMSPEVAEKLKELMRNNVKTNYGDYRYKGLHLCAKSGTAQIDDVTEHNTAWFVGFMDDSENPYAFVVVIEKGGSGSQNAGPAANKVLQKVVDKD